MKNQQGEEVTHYVITEDERKMFNFKNVKIEEIKVPSLISHDTNKKKKN